ncbi:MAG: ABC transporter ATP-binding protein [Phycisphaerae bacterium]|nr:ABC transporter ATP-binding protein [Phycisphaerae bacterium]
MRFELERVSLRFRGPPPVDALADVTLSIDTGERLALMGSSGSGKSSLLRVLAGLEAPSDGRVLRDGADITALEPPARDVAMVLQDAPLYGHLSLRDNAAHPLRMRGVRAADARRVSDGMLERVGLSARAAAKASEVSGGERRRAALARALVWKPALLLLDEPFASLDPASRLSLRDLVRELCTEMNCACVHATHDGLEALALGTTLAVLDRGRLVDHGSPSRLWSSPACEASSQLLGDVPMNLVSLAGANGDSRRVGLRPEHVRVAASDGAAAGAARARSPSASIDGAAWSADGRIVGIDSLGDRSLLSIRLGDGSLVRAIVAASAPSATTDAARSAAHHEGDSVSLSAAAESLVEFHHAAEART